ncbi:carboxypeptidase-like regulatory domain-containing protein [Aquimarina rubra]|uniref:Carboxypeptidase-like regulatory domain-containing protein n=1 Tax=Aquimarina rubra TaxID=1920033 RepID=A0ABW5LII8_9FLAO
MMKNGILIKYVVALIFLISIKAFAQEGTVSGTLTDDSGLPLPGVNIMIKGTTIGTQTDFDGNYSIQCNIDDILVFSYIGFSAREVLVTGAIFGEEGNATMVKKKPIQKIRSDAYTNAIQRTSTPKIKIPSLEDVYKTYNKNGSYFDYSRIRNIEIGKDKIKLSYFRPNTYYEVGWNSKTGFQFINNKNLPELQSVYSQGRPFNGENTFFGPETGEIFSFGPRTQTLEFDGSAYEYDQNGRLVALGNGNGNPSNVYNNSIFKTSIKTSNNVFLNISTDNDFYGFDYQNKIIEDIFGEEQSSHNEFTVSYRNSKSSNKPILWDTFIKYSNAVDNQPNINGFQNNLLLNTYATPISFGNNQGIQLTDNSQRSFSPNRFNNPIWLLKTNQNQVMSNILIASLQNKFGISDDAYFKTILNYTNSARKERFGLPRSTAGFLEGYVSHKNVDINEFDSNLVFRLEKYMNDSKLKIDSKINYTYRNLNYSLFEAERFSGFSFSNPQTSSERTQKLDRNTFRMLHTFAYTIADISTTITAGNNSFTSSLQNSKWFLPTLGIKTDLDNYIDVDWLRRFTVAARTSFDVNDISLFYTNQSHNSLLIQPQESLEYTANNDLFISNDIHLEEKISYELGVNIDTELFYGDVYLDLGFNYFNNRTNNSVFPVFEQNEFQLKNIADVSNKGFELSLNISIRDYNDFWYSPGIVFSSYRTKVLDILDEDERIPFAGFSSVSKNLIKGQPAGVFVGSAYQRDNQNNIIIDNQGFPIVAPDLKVIGDPTPEYSIGFSNWFHWKKFRFNFLIDFQKGGDVWNGTQNVLNYLGTSQLSAEQRQITGFVFNGVNQEGERNTIPVDFANPINGLSGNKFVRYGYEGVAEDAIVDGSYINLKSINFTYDLAKNRSNHFLRDLTIGIYANNLFTWSKYRGASPYSNLFDQHSSHGLNFFNTPITSEIGFKINLKI